jgi:hypothetical protein
VSVYTLGIWLVKPGRENDFVQAWHDLARRTKEEFPAAKALLMHDRDVPNQLSAQGRGSHWNKSINGGPPWRTNRASRH